MMKVEPIRKQKLKATLVIVITWVVIFTITVAASRGYIIPWPERLGWYKIPYWYYSITQAAICQVGAMGIYWIWTQPEEME